jgi:hypothetical protein
MSNHKLLLVPASLRHLPNWTPETSLLFLLLGGYSHGNANQENAKKLLCYYQQAVRELGETERLNALKIQYKCGVDVCVEGIITPELSDIVIGMESEPPATTQFVESYGEFGVDVTV